MKKIITAIIIAASFTSAANAQVSVNINIGNQPAWGPVGYDRADYYYLPDIDVYYYIPEQVYFYFDGFRWVRTPFLPARYQAFDLYRAHKVVINNVDRPYLNNDRYRREYSVYRNRFDQTPLRDQRNNRFADNNRNDRRDDRFDDNRNYQQHAPQTDNRNNRVQQQPQPNRNQPAPQAGNRNRNDDRGHDSRVNRRF